MRLDLHVHTRHSYDATAPVRAVLSAAGEAALDGLVVTDHDTMAGSLAAARLAPSYGLFAVPGVEVSTRDGHLLALGVHEAPPAGDPMSETVATVRDRGGVAVAPHPFQWTRHGADGDSIRRADPDAVETFNAHAMTGIQSRRARRFAAREGCPRVAGSDAHVPEMVGRAYTEVTVAGGEDDPAGVDPPQVLDALRAGRTTVHGRRAPVGRYVGKLAYNVGLRTGGGLARMRALL